jgi:hypothetical protein
MVIGNASVGFHITPTIPQQILIVKLLLRHYTSLYSPPISTIAFIRKASLVILSLI